MISYRLEDLDGMWVTSLLIDIPFMTLRVALKNKRLKCHFQRDGLHACMIHMFDNLVMTWLQISSAPSRMTCHSMMFIHPLVHTLLRMHICFMRNFDHCAQILRNTRTWPPQNSHRFIFKRKSIFILEISMEIHKGFFRTWPPLTLFCKRSCSILSSLISS
jgi:hypothetical protein